MTRLVARLVPILAMGAALAMTWAWAFHHLTTALASVQ